MKTNVVYASGLSAFEYIGQVAKTPAERELNSKILFKIQGYVVFLYFGTKNISF